MTDETAGEGSNAITTPYAFPSSSHTSIPPDARRSSHAFARRGRARALSIALVRPQHTSTHSRSIEDATDASLDEDAGDGAFELLPTALTSTGRLATNGGHSYYQLDGPDQAGNARPRPGPALALKMGKKPFGFEEIDYKEKIWIGSGLLSVLVLLIIGIIILNLPTDPLPPQDPARILR